jgi:hypothetical protein
MNCFMLSGGKSPLVAALFLMLAVCQPAFAGTWNKPPTISGTPSTTGKVGVAYAFQPSASDPEGRTLTFSVSNRPAWASFSKSTGRLSGTPTAAGTFSNIRISVSDGRKSKSLSAFTITVAPAGSVPIVNKPPTITGTPPASVAVGQAYGFTPTASDPEGKPLTFTIANKPAWGSFSTSTGRLSGTPTSAGTHTSIAIAVSDGTATATLAAFSITVGSTNRVPVITGTPVTAAKAGQPYSFKPTAQDPDGDPLTFSITNKPAWATFDASTGTLYGTPTSANVATFSNIVISASDGKASASLPAFAITVAAAATGSITVSWVPPTQNTDGTPVTGLSGFRVYYGTASRQYGQSVLVSGPSLRSVVVEGLSPGTTWYFGVKSVSNTGLESDYSNEAVKALL